MKKWCIKVITMWFLVVIIWGMTVYVTDPFFHYHKPIEGLYYDLTNSGYKNDGIAKNFDYNALITGASTSQKYSVSEAESLFEKQFILLSFPGEGFYRISKGVRTALESQNDIDMVIWSLDPMWFISDEFYEGHADEGYPEYLYNDSIWDDVTYLYNKDLMVTEVIPILKKTLSKEPPVSFYANTGEKTDAKMEYERGQRENIKVDDNLYQGYMENLALNINGNIIDLIKDYPDTEFYFVIAPYNIAWWDSLKQSGEGRIEKRLELEEYVVRTLIGYDNVMMFSFNNEKEIVCDTANYIDSVHPRGDVPSYVLKAISRGDNRITTDNCDEYFAKEKEFYTTFDYDTFFNDFYSE